MPDNSIREGVRAVAELQICLLGPFQVCWDFSPLAPTAWQNPFAQRLLKLALVLRPEPADPAELVRKVGGRMTPADLPAAVDRLNLLLAPAARVETGPDGRLRFVPGPGCWIDADALLAHYEGGLRAAARGEMLPAILAFQEADAIYQGDLLEDVQEPWVVPARRRFQDLYTEILDRLAEGHAVLARYQDAVGFCHKALAHDPLREPTYQRMMVYYYYLGDMSGAAEAYHECGVALASTGRRVSEATEALWQQLQLGGPSPGAIAAAAIERTRRRPS